jgi:hypothetical protein
VNRNFDISNNVFDSCSNAIYLSTTLYDEVNFVDTLDMRDNTFNNCTTGMYQSFEVSDYCSLVERDWVIENNVLDDCDSGVYLYYSTSSSSENEVIETMRFDGNSFRGGSSGLHLSYYHSYTQTWDLELQITKNLFEDQEYTAFYLEASFDSGYPEHQIEYRGNVISGCDRAINFDWEADSTNSLVFDGGTNALHGFNTISAGEGDAESSSVYFSVHHHNNASLNLIGNWWGTQDLLEIEDRVYHGADWSFLGGPPPYSVDYSNPLPDSLDFTATYVDGVGLVVSAGADAGFVAYAGDLLMTGSIAGPGGYSDGGEIDASWVSEDYGTVTLPSDIFDEAPSGTYDICLTNPGGQTGCASFTIGDGEDCSQNQIPTAVSEDADTDPQTAVTVDVTANDWDPNGNLDPTTVQLVDTPDKGTAVVNADGSITYTPDDDLLDDADAMTYVVYDTCGSPSNAATLHIRIGGHVNLIPTAGYDEVVTEQDAAITIDVLANDYDPDGTLDTGSVQIIDTPDKGAAVVNADGSITYTPNPGVVATTDTFTYTVNDNDGGTSNAATVGILIQHPTETEDVTGGVSGDAGRSGQRGARGGLGNGANPNQGRTRSL